MIKGYIEGYYGRLFSQDERAKVIDHMGRLKMDFYLYGPKEDLYHRVQWQKAYPFKEQKTLRHLVSQCKKNKIRPIFAISPGLQSSKTSNNYKKNLITKIKQAKKIGFKEFAIFFDDIEHKQNEDLARTHLKIINSVSSINTLSENSLMVCPTVYCKSFAKGDIKENEYLKALANAIDPSISILWTGDEVVSQSIPQKGIKELKRLFSNPIVIWDNFYANDYCPSRFYIGPYKGRNSLTNLTEAIGINPTGMPFTDMICLSRFMGKKTDKQILDEFGIPDEFIKIFPYFTDPFKDLPSLSLKNIDKLLKTQYKLCIEWKSDLQLEWAPFLWAFYLDLILLKKIKTGDGKFNLDDWAKRRYSDPLKKTILRN